MVLTVLLKPLHTPPVSIDSTKFSINLSQIKKFNSERKNHMKIWIKTSGLILTRYMLNCDMKNLISVTNEFLSQMNCCDKYSISCHKSRAPVKLVTQILTTACKSTTSQQIIYIFMDIHCLYHNSSELNILVITKVNIFKKRDNVRHAYTACTYPYTFFNSPLTNTHKNK